MRARFIAVIIVPCLLLSSHPGRAADDPVLPFVHAAWSAEAWSHRAGGEVGWLSGPDGSLRLELGLADNGPGPRPLLTQAGDGWTLILGPDGEGTLNAWHREWRTVEPGLGRLAAEAVTFMSRSGAEAEKLRIEIPELAVDDEAVARSSGFRDGMVRRGRGRGGPGEMVILERFDPGDSSRWAFEVRSTRRPGRFRVGATGSLGLICPVPEVFLPLWPLSEISENTEIIPGTSEDADR